MGFSHDGPLFLGINRSFQIKIISSSFTYSRMNTTIAFKMKLTPGLEEEYEKRHREIWPELSLLLKEAGIKDYAIYLDRETSTLFAVQTITGEGSSQSLGSTAIVQKWWAYMADIMETNPDNSPVSVPLKEVFTLE